MRKKHSSTDRVRAEQPDICGGLDGLSAEKFPVSAFAGSSKILKDLKDERFTFAGTITRNEAEIMCWGRPPLPGRPKMVKSTPMTKGLFQGVDPRINDSIPSSARVGESDRQQSKGLGKVIDNNRKATTGRREGSTGHRKEMLLVKRDRFPGRGPHSR